MTCLVRILQETPSTSNVPKLQVEDIALASPASPEPDLGESPKILRSRRKPLARGFLLERRMLVIFYFFLHFVTTESRFARSQSFRIRSGPIHNSPLLLALHMTFRCRSKVARFQDPLQAWMSMKLKTGNTTHSPTTMMSKRGKETFSVCSCLSPPPALMVSVLSERRGGGGFKAMQWTTWARPYATP